MKPPLGRKVTTADADHCRTLKAIGSAEDSCCALDRLQWVRNGLTLTTADDYNSKVLSERGGAGQRVGYTKTGPRASPNRITQNHTGHSTALAVYPCQGSRFWFHGMSGGGSRSRFQSEWLRLHN